MANSEGVALLAIEKLDEIFYVVRLQIYIYIYICILGLCLPSALITSCNTRRFLVL